MLGLLDAVDRNSGQSQRNLATELGVALGLVNAYLKRCTRKGLVKVSQAPARRYAYYLTPQGFAEKSRLTMEYLSYSFGFFRQAKADCSAVFEQGRSRGLRRVVLAGQSELAEIAALCARESNVEILGIVQPNATASHFAGLPIFENFVALDTLVDGVVVTDLANAKATFSIALAMFGVNRVLIPELLRVRASQVQEALS